MPRKDHVDQPIKFLLQSAYSANKGKRWKRKELGVVDRDVKNEKFRQCLLSNYLSLKAFLIVAKTHTDRCTQSASQERK
jgi:hypothetical protein